MSTETYLKIRAVLFITMLVVAEVRQAETRIVKEMMTDLQSQHIMDELFDKSIDSLTDKIVNRALNAWSILSADLENTILKKGDSTNQRATSASDLSPLYQVPRAAQAQRDPQVHAAPRLFWPIATSPGPTLRDSMELGEAKRTAELISACSAKFPIISALTLGSALVQLGSLTKGTLPLDHLVAPSLAIAAALAAYTTTYSLLETYYVTTALSEAGNEEDRVCQVISTLDRFSRMRNAARDSMWASLSLVLVAIAMKKRMISVPATVSLLVGVVLMLLTVYFFRTAYQPLLGTSAKFIQRRSNGSLLGRKCGLGMPAFFR